MRFLARTPAFARVRVLARTPAVVQVRVLVRTPALIRMRILVRTLPARVRAFVRTLAGGGAAQQEIQRRLDLELPGGTLDAVGVQVQRPTLDVLPGDHRLPGRHLPGRQPRIAGILLNRRTCAS